MDDLERMREIAVAAWTPIFERYLHVVGECLWRDVWGGWHNTWFRRDPEKWEGRAIVTEVDGKIVGFATWFLLSDTACEVGGNAVDPAFHGHGYGTAQIREVLDICRRQGCTFARVHTGLDPSHGPARRQYQRAGLTIPVKNSVFLNSLCHVAQLPRTPFVEVRSWRLDDGDSLEALIRAAWDEVDVRLRDSIGDAMFEACYPDRMERRIRRAQGILEKSPERVRVALEGDELVGVAIVDAEKEKRLGSITQLGVHPSSRNQGVASTLCMDAFEWFRSQGLRHARMLVGIGEFTDASHSFACKVGLCRELPSVDYFAQL